MIVKPKSCTNRAKIDKTSSAAIGSRALVGSSRSKTFGCIVKTAAMATRCASPPLNVDRERFLNCANPNKSKVSSTRLRITSLGTPKDSIPKAISSSTVSVTKPSAGF